MIWKTRRGVMDLSTQGGVMGILNITPDSFSDGGAHQGFAQAWDHARRMIAEGVSIIDVGGESTRPGAAPVSSELEIERTAPAIAAIRREWDGLISIDTSKAAVAQAAIDAGADIVNDVTGLTGDPAMTEVCERSGCGIVAMHMKGEPRTMQVDPVYENVVAEVSAFFTERLTSLTSVGIRPEAICFDPGIGFGKTTEHNLQLLRHLEELAPPGRPLLLGVSRKSFIAAVLGEKDLRSREWPTIGLTAYARAKGVMLHRVHAVRENLHALRMIEAIRPDASNAYDAPGPRDTAKR